MRKVRINAFCGLCSKNYNISTWCFNGMECFLVLNAIKKFEEIKGMLMRYVDISGIKRFSCKIYYEKVEGLCVQI